MRNRTFEKVKDGVKSAAGITFMGLYGFLIFLPIIFPLYMIGTPVWAILLIDVGLYLLSFLPGIILLAVTLTIWIVSIPYAVHCGSVLLIVIYIICAAVYVALGLIPSVISIISAIIDGISAWREERRFRKFFGRRYWRIIKKTERRW